MQSRKKHNLEIEKQKKAQRRIQSFIFGGIILAIVAVIGYFIWDAIDRRWIMTFEGERIPTNELRLLAELNSTEINAQTRQPLIDLMVQNLTIMDRAASHNIAMTATEREEFLNTPFSPDLPDMPMQVFVDHLVSAGYANEDRVIEFLNTGAGDPLVRGLVDIYEPHYEVDFEEFDELFDQFWDSNAFSYSDMEVRYIGSLHPELLEELLEDRERLNQDFDQIAEEYCEFYLEEFGVVILSVATFIEAFGIYEPALIYALQEGEFTETFISGVNGFFIVQMYSRYDHTSREEVEAELLEEFIFDRRLGNFWENHLQIWMEEANYSVNNRTLNRF